MSIERRSQKLCAKRISSNSYQLVIQVKAYLPLCPTLNLNLLFRDFNLPRNTVQPVAHSKSAEKVEIPSYCPESGLISVRYFSQGVSKIGRIMYFLRLKFLQILLHFGHCVKLCENLAPLVRTTT